MRIMKQTATHHMLLVNENNDWWYGFVNVHSHDPAEALNELCKNTTGEYEYSCGKGALHFVSIYDPVRKVLIPPEDAVIVLPAEQGRIRNKLIVVGHHPHVKLDFIDTLVKKHFA